MTESIVTILNAKLLTSGYFTNPYGLCEMVEKDGITRPLLYCSNGERKHVTNFDELNGSCYWRKTGAITITEIENKSLITKDKLNQLTIPLKLVGVVSREKTSTDNGSTAENVGLTIFKTIQAHLNGNLRKIIKAKAVYTNPKNIEDRISEIMKTEFIGSTDKGLGSKLIAVSIDLDIVVEIYESCIITDCNLLTVCQALLLSLTASDKNECLLPTYDFSDTSVTDNLTDEQTEALIELLCEGGEFTYDLYVDGVDTGEDILVDGSDITINLE